MGRWAARTTCTCLPAATQFRVRGLLHGVEPLHPVAREGDRTAVRLAHRPHDHVPARDKLGFGKELVKNIKLVKGKGGMEEPDVEGHPGEINRGVWTIRLHGPVPERLQAHMRNMQRVSTSRRCGRARQGREDGLTCSTAITSGPWPCWARRALNHPGSPNLYDTSKHVMDGGGTPRQTSASSGEGRPARGRRLASKGRRTCSSLPESTRNFLKKLGWWTSSPTTRRRPRGKNWKTDTSGGIIRVVMKNHGCHPFATRGARDGGLELPGSGSAAPRAESNSPSPELVEKYPSTTTGARSGRMPTLYKSAAAEERRGRGLAKKFPLILTSGRLVEYEGGGEETRSKPVACRNCSRTCSSRSTRATPTTPR